MLPFARDAWPYLWKLTLIAVLCWLFDWGLLMWLFAGLTVFTAFFFRDPERAVPLDRTLVMSPADGRVMRVEAVDHDEFLGGPGRKVSIFLSVFNVHINRSPITGTVRLQQYRAGKMLPAFKSHASEENERNTLGIEGQDIRVLVHQITGFIARRIVCRKAPGDKLLQGQRFGLIKFGSCTELLVPDTVQVLVAAGAKVKGGETVIGRIRDGET